MRVQKPKTFLVTLFLLFLCLSAKAQEAAVKIDASNIIDSIPKNSKDLDQALDLLSNESDSLKFKALLKDVRLGFKDSSLLSKNHLSDSISLKKVAKKRILDSLAINDKIAGSEVGDLIENSKELEEKLKGLEAYSSVDSQLFQMPYDSATIQEAIQEYANLNDSSKIVQINNQEIKAIMEYKAMIDSANYENLEKQLSSIAEAYVGEEPAFKEIRDFKQVSSQFPSPQNNELKWDSAKIADKIKVKSLLKDKKDLIGLAREKGDKLKRKYSDYSVGDSTFNLKRRQKPDKRWQLSFNIESAFRPHLKISMAPGVLYNVNKKWNLGLASAFDYNYHYKDTSYSSFGASPTIRLFTQYDIYKHFFIQGEYEQPFELNFSSTENKNSPEMKLSPNIWLGGGIEYKVYKKLRAQTQILYNLKSLSQPLPDQNKWSVRVNFIY